MHGITASSVSLATVLELVKFLKYLGKGDYFQKKNILKIKAPDSSSFEEDLLDQLCELIINKKLPLDTKLLACTLSNSFDGFNGAFEKV